MSVLPSSDATGLDAEWHQSTIVFRSWSNVQTQGLCAKAICSTKTEAMPVGCGPQRLPTTAHYGRMPSATLGLFINASSVQPSGLNFWMR